MQGRGKRDKQRKKPKTFVQFSMLLLLVLVARTGPIDLLLPVLPFFSFIPNKKQEGIVIDTRRSRPSSFLDGGVGRACLSWLSLVSVKKSLRVVKKKV